MTRFDLTPLFRSSIGFDHLSQLIDSAFDQATESMSYPPYNIEKLSEDNYRISMAVAGFEEDEIAITAQDNTLTVSAKSKQDNDKREFLYRGIAGRAFERRFQLADYIRVTDAAMNNGMLHIDMVREVPERMKPRIIEIASGKKAQKIIDNKAA